jgi:L-2-hydroxycarboxylate dehydrogenase (NAD+)
MRTPTTGEAACLVAGAVLGVGACALLRPAPAAAAPSPPAPPPTHLAKAAALRSFVAAVLASCGVPAAAAREGAAILVLADLRGIDSHGVARLRKYYEMLRSGAINARPAIRVVHEAGSTALVDGDNGLGLVVGPWANRLAMEKAAGPAGSGWVAVRNSNHFGIAGAYALVAADKDLIGVAMTNAGASVAPCFGAQRMLGTNPMAYSFPGGARPPVLVDLATSVVPFGKVEEYLRAGATMPEGWGVGPGGAPTRAPADVKAGGALLPLGGDRQHSSHKGYCLGAVVDMLCGVLPGAGWGPTAQNFASAVAAVDNGQKKIGHFFGAMRPSGFRPDGDGGGGGGAAVSGEAAFKGEVDNWVDAFHACTPSDAAQPVLVPGDPEREAQRARSVAGVPIKLSVWRDLLHVAELSGAALPLDAASLAALRAKLEALSEL